MTKEIKVEGDYYEINIAMTKDEAIKQRDECKHCHGANLTGGTVGLPYCSGCILAKETLGDDWWTFSKH